MGGHGIGRLGDEYRSSNDTISQAAKEDILKWEGAGYKYGVWRPEETSCMISNLPYFNSPSRFWIVKRLLESAGEVTPTENGEPAAVRAAKIQKVLEIFLEKDIQKTNPYGT